MEAVLPRALQVTWPQAKDELRERLGRSCPIWQIIKLDLAMPVRSPSEWGVGEGGQAPGFPISLDVAGQEGWTLGRKPRGPFPSCVNPGSTSLSYGYR